MILRGERKIAFEFKYSSAPKVTRSMRAALEDLDLDRIVVVYPGDGVYPLAERIEVANLEYLARGMRGAPGADRH